MLGRLQVVMRNNIVDGDKDVRSSTRGMFEAFALSYPTQAERAFEGFTTQTQKTIMQERKAK